MKSYMKANLLAARTFLDIVNDYKARDTMYIPVQTRSEYPKLKFKRRLFMRVPSALPAAWIEIILHWGGEQSSPFVEIQEDWHVIYYKEFKWFN